MSSGSIAARGRRAGKSPWVERLGRAGLVAKGVLYASRRDPRDRRRAGQPQGEPGQERRAAHDRGAAVRQGAADRCSRSDSAGYALWQLSLAILDRENEGEGAKGLAKRAAALARAGWYGVLCGLTVSTLVGNGSGDGNEQAADGRRLRPPGGRYLVYAAGLAFLAAGAFNGYRAITCKFNKKLKQEEMSQAEEAAATGVGILGHLARARRLRPDRGLPHQGGLGVRLEAGARARRALLELVQQPYGEALLGAVAVGPARLRPLLLRAGPVPPHLNLPDLPWKTTTFLPRRSLARSTLEPCCERERERCSPSCTRTRPGATARSPLSSARRPVRRRAASIVLCITDHVCRTELADAPDGSHGRELRRLSRRDRPRGAPGARALRPARRSRARAHLQRPGPGTLGSRPGRRPPAASSPSTTESTRRSRPRFRPAQR